MENKPQCGENQLNKVDSVRCTEYKVPSFVPNQHVFNMQQARQNEKFMSSPQPPNSTCIDTMNTVCNLLCYTNRHINSCCILDTKYKRTNRCAEPCGVHLRKTWHHPECAWQNDATVVKIR